jgi:hypothetical protein
MTWFNIVVSTDIKPKKSNRINTQQDAFSKEYHKYLILSKEDMLIITFKLKINHELLNLFFY